MADRSVFGFRFSVPARSRSIPLDLSAEALAKEDAYDHRGVSARQGFRVTLCFTNGLSVFIQNLCSAIPENRSVFGRFSILSFLGVFASLREI